MVCETDVLVHELALEFCFKSGDRANELCARLLEQRLGRDGAVSLNLDEEVWLQGMWDFVPRKEDLRHGEELAEMVEMRSAGPQ